MLFRFIGTTVILGMIIRFADLNKGGFFRTVGGQIVHGALSIACLVTRDEFGVPQVADLMGGHRSVSPCVQRATPSGARVCFLRDLRLVAY
jgi:hypothetical protein